MKVSGTSISAPGCTNGSIRREKRAATAAATIPLGAIQARRCRSFHVSSEPNAAVWTFIGRAKNCNTRNTKRAGMPSFSKSAKDRPAAMMMKSDETSRIEMLSLKSSMSSTCSIFALASQIPATVTASRPDSSFRKFESVKIARTKASAERFIRYSGRRCFLSASPKK